MKEDREACIYERRGSLFVVTCLQTEVGLWLEQGACTMLPSSVEPAIIGQAARDALSRSGKIIPHPTEWKSVDEDNPILELAGIKRWSAFRKGARALGVSLYDDRIELIPSENEGSQGFGHLTDDSLRLAPDASTEELGTAINEALRRCK